MKTNFHELPLLYCTHTWEQNKKVKSHAKSQSCNRLKFNALRFYDFACYQLLW